MLKPKALKHRFSVRKSRMLEYDIKILLAFGEAINGNEKIFSWLLNNGYPELSALSWSIRGSDEAFQWLMKNKFPQLAALDSAIDNSEKAYQWLKENEYFFLIIFADACHGKPEAIKWLRENNLEVFIRLGKIVKDLRDSQTFDYHKIHF